MLQHQDGTFTGHDGLSLFYQTWQRPENLWASLIMLHGLGAHSSLYPTVVNHLVHQGMSVASFDLRGHGRSPGQRGYIQQWSDFRQDLNCFLDFVTAHHPNRPCFLWGHSLGAIIALDFATRHPQTLNGVIASAAPIGKISIAPYKILIAQMLSRVWPRFSLNSGIKLKHLSQDQAYLMTRQADPWRHSQGTARLTTEFLATQTWLVNQAANLQLPVLMLHGEYDAIAACNSTQTYFQQIGSPNKTFIQYPGAYHDLHADACAPNMFSDLEHWLIQQQPNTQPTNMGH